MKSANLRELSIRDVTQPYLKALHTRCQEIHNSFHLANSSSLQATVLDKHEPDVFSVYLHCVIFGRKALKAHKDALAVTSSERVGKGEKSIQENDENRVIEETQSIGL